MSKQSTEAATSSSHSPSLMSGYNNGSTQDVGNAHFEADDQQGANNTPGSIPTPVVRGVSTERDGDGGDCDDMNDSNTVTRTASGTVGDEEEEMEEEEEEGSENGSRASAAARSATTTGAKSGLAGGSREGGAGGAEGGVNLATVKRPMNSFMVFAQERRPQLKKQYPSKYACDLSLPLCVLCGRVRVCG